MSLKIPRWAYELGAILVTIFLFYVMGERLMRANGLALQSGNPVFGDFIAFWAAGKLALSGHPELVHHVPTIQAIQWEAVPGMTRVAGWNSPPQFLLIACVLALFSYPVAALIWLIGTFALFLYAASKFLHDKRALLFALTVPAAIYHIGSIQTGLWVAGMSGLALYYLDKKPIRAGAFIAMMAIKPHLAVFWPIYLALTGRWRAFGAAAAASLLFAGAAALAFGWEVFPRFLANLDHTSSLISDMRVSKATFGSLFANLIAMGVPQLTAMIVHAISAVLAFAAAVFVWRRGDAAAQGAALCAATLLASPYLFYYDYTLLAMGGAVLVWGGRPRDWFETLALVFAWGAGLSLAIGVYQPVPLCPFSAWLLLIASLKRALSSAPGAAHPSRKSPGQPRSDQSSLPATA
ncbi:MAG: glycosyltransferase family 87 protein [Hyphomonadaceae bacterium]|nr:glycosyltransferase family 87 protein [Hyphomonadaceae bacterium]